MNSIQRRVSSVGSVDEGSGDSGSASLSPPIHSLSTIALPNQYYSRPYNYYSDQPQLYQSRGSTGSEEDQTNDSVSFDQEKWEEMRQQNYGYSKQYQYYQPHDNDDNGSNGQLSPNTPIDSFPLSIHRGENYFYDEEGVTRVASISDYHSSNNSIPLPLYYNYGSAAPPFSNDPSQSNYEATFAYATYSDNSHSDSPPTGPSQSFPGPTNYNSTFSEFNSSIGSAPFNSDSYPSTSKVNDAPRLTKRNSANSTDTEARPYGCDECSHAFHRNHDLKRHKRIHLEFKPYPCSWCDKRFTRKDALKRHLLVKQHPVTPEEVARDQVKANAKINNKAKRVAAALRVSNSKLKKAAASKAALDEANQYAIQPSGLNSSQEIRFDRPIFRTEDSSESTSTLSSIESETTSSNREGNYQLVSGRDDNIRGGLIRNHQETENQSYSIYDSMRLPIIPNYSSSVY